TFSKCFGMMGWRVGFMLADAAICTEAIKVQDAMIICAPRISQIAAEAAVRHGWDHPIRFHGGLLKRREAMVEGLRHIPQVQSAPAPAALFGFVRIDNCSNSAALAASLLEEAHVVTIPGSAFGRSGEGHLRLSYGAASVEQVREATSRLARYFATTGVA